ncbi:hypothetical protein [Enterobacter cloacae complex sp. 2015409]|uniref:hypothetical protein n=1 Tax=Enterobacter cloacae complex sp. 2015409 TaxID=3239216 RepID=UPI0035236CAA
MINITTKDGTQVSGEVRDLVILLETDGKTVSDYLQPIPPKKDTHWSMIFIPVAIYILLNLVYIIAHPLLPEKYLKTSTSIFLFISFILSAIVAYFVFHKHKSATLSIFSLVFLVLIVGANVGFISYSDLTQKATQKLDSLSK